MHLRSGLAALALVLAGFGGVAGLGGGEAGAKEEGKVLRHIVMYKFKDSTTPEQVQQVIDAFSGLPKKVDGIVGFEHGPNTSTEGKSEGMTHVFVVTFKDEAALAAYLKHPAHDAYVLVVKDKREKVLVFDYWVSK